MKDTVLRDNILAMFGVNYKMADESIMEIQIYGMKDGKTIFHSRAHQMKLQMECDYGIYKGTAIKTEVLLHSDRYLRASESIGYEFDPAGGLELPETGLSDRFLEPVSALLAEKYPTSGTLVSVGDKVKNLLNLESFKYYLQMPEYIYPNNERIAQLGFMTFVLNSVIVIGFAMVAQVILCSVCAFVISRQLSPRASKAVLLFFLLKLPEQKKFRIVHILLAVIIAGGIGNMIDRFRLDYVVDFISFVLINYPIFNVADIYVVVATIGLFILFLFVYKEKDLEFLNFKQNRYREMK